MTYPQEILAIGINHKYASVEVREKIDPEKITQAIHVNLYPQLFTEWIVITTCNRTEVYAVTSDPSEAENKMRKLFPMKNYYFYKNQDAIKHIFYVAAGLDSMILGETEILAQIKTSYEKAECSKTIGPILHQLLKDALRVGKLCRHKTCIGTGVTSVSQAALLLAKKHLGELSGKKVLLIGAGDIAERVLKSLVNQEISEITVVNRTYRRAVELTEKFGGKPDNFDKIPSLISQNDLIISATASPDCIISVPMVEKAMKQNSFHQLCLIDLAVPRDIDQSASEVKGVQLYNIDDMQKVVNVNVKLRQDAAVQVEQIIEKEIGNFSYWHATRKAAPVLHALTSKFDSIKNQELEKAFQKLSHLTLHDKKIVTILAKRLESKLLARPIENLKQATRGEDGQEYLEMVKTLFEL